MNIIIVTLFVCAILGISYIWFGKEQKRKKKDEYRKSMLVRAFYQQEMGCMQKIQLEGIGNDVNSDFEFIQAVQKINLPSDVRVQIYD